ncbi:LpqB family beta-propeller domain-containing protein [Microbacterium sp. JZ31]|uniref:LpqB family beta-propeller domain-containing protein n=1 Tax=Microbacterium sp. JZ31 TaxID=1906274 RepID=UPI00193196B6|nr:LpqB family beta-propeller domain-containing protein [Microbacterium sp. JZ31]
MSRPVARGRVGVGAALLALILALAGCTGLPTSGEVFPGLEPGAAPDEAPVQLYAIAPTRGATPEQIVNGFIEAAISPLDGWETARLFLAGELAGSWRPEAGVIVDVADAREVQVDEEAGRVTLTVTPTATVDEHGSYATSSAGPIELSYRLAQRDDGEWRIVEAPEGIILDQQQFPDVYSDHALQYFDPTWTYLVPDVRWFPASGNTATYVVRELVNGAPSAWLSGSVASAFGQDIRLDPDAVPVDTDGVAHVGLNAVAAGADTTALGRMMTQLTESLANADVRDVRLTIAEQPDAVVDVEPVRTAQTRPDSRPLVLRSGEFGFLSGGDLTPIDGLSEAIEDMAGTIDSITVAPDQRTAAVRQSTGIVYRVTSESPDQVDAERENLIPPMIDPFGYVWTVPSDDPTAIRAWDPDLEPIAITDGLGEATSVREMAMSRDGTRVAALVASGGQHVVVVASVRRDRTGKPTGLGEATRTTVLPQPGVSIAWIEDTRLGIVAGQDDTWYVFEQQVGGPSQRSIAPTDTATIEYGTADSAVRLRGADGLLYTRRGSSWQQTGAEVSVLATQMGTPQGAD